MPLFFGLQRPKEAVADIVALVGTTSYLIYVWSKVDTVASWLMVPYLGWLSFATYLTVSHVMCHLAMETNMDPDRLWYSQRLGFFQDQGGSQDGVGYGRYYQIGRLFPWSGIILALKYSLYKYHVKHKTVVQKFHFYVTVHQRLAVVDHPPSNEDEHWQLEE
jgi:hypothetical protein